MRPIPLSAVLTAVVFTSWGAAEELRPAQAARQVDRLLQRELFADAAVEQAPLSDDETFLRRVSLDLVGTLPTPDELSSFVLDPDPKKRTAAVNRLLADSRFGQNWARYWRDAILFRRSDERALTVSASAERYLADAFNGNVPWDELARSFIAAEGSLREDGSTALIASQWGEVPETAAEVSRLFLGVQIQCAQCHDHPTDRWTREQFHELAAFFPRIGIRAIRVDGQRRGFELFSRDPGKAQRNRMNKRFEHYMPDLDDPAANGTLMEPVFFVTGQRLEPGLPDLVRRSTLADWITSPENPWFAKAFVNRTWAEMVGEGFYEPVDDIGPDRTCWAPETLDFLSEQFVASGYDVKWLFRTIALTEAYQRDSLPRRTAEGVPFAASCPQRLRGDQIFSSLAAALGVEKALERNNRRRPGQGPERAARNLFQGVFGYDPSAPRDEVQGAIPQALMMMNSPAIARAIDARRDNSTLGRLAADITDDEALIAELYLRCLAREPSAEELQACLDYFDEVDDRAEAVEDLAWALINSTEFLYRR